MMIRTALDVAAVDSRAWPSQLRVDSQKDRAAALLRTAFWQGIWPRIQDERLSITVWFLRPSVRVAALKPLFERIFGDDPNALVAATFTEAYPEEVVP